MAKEKLDFLTQAAHSRADPDGSHHHHRGARQPAARVRRGHPRHQPRHPARGARHRGDHRPVPLPQVPASSSRWCCSSPAPTCRSRSPKASTSRTIPIVLALVALIGVGLINYVVKLLPTGLEPRPREKSPEGIRALFYAIEKNNLVYAQKVLAMNFDPNLHHDNGYTPLAYAAMKGSAPMIELLLRNGADPAADHQGRRHAGRARPAHGPHRGRRPPQAGAQGAPTASRPAPTRRRGSRPPRPASFSGKYEPRWGA